MDGRRDLTALDADVSRKIERVLSRHSVTGKLLDIGGGERAGYRYLLESDTYDSVNIDPGAEPTWVVGVGERLPCPDREYDIVLS
ncbi:MAG: hypothetical protein IH933_13485, partial [Euryarchaeota archaeon]|nr:hypothetical protein [Euryarchaeota archaeon]